MQARYHMLLGIKFAMVLGLVFVLSALAGHSPKLAFIRENSQTWLTAAIILAVAIVALSGTVRQLQRPMLIGAAAETRLTVPDLH